MNDEINNGPEAEKPRKINNQYSVSLVYQKRTKDNLETALKCGIIDAVSKEEALGKFILQLQDEFEDHQLALKVVLKITPTT